MASAPRRIPRIPRSTRKVWEMLHVAHVFEQAGEFDLIHNQADFVPLAFSRVGRDPDGDHDPRFSRLSAFCPPSSNTKNRVHYVAISQADRHPDLRYAATIHHGIPLEDFPFHPYGSEDLLFFGRIHPDKGAAEAITAARRSGRKLIMAGIVQDQNYHNEQVAPRTRRPDCRLPWPGRRRGRRAKTLGSARALLHLINFDEPFGLSVVEALACGTPVIACNRGSMPELIDDGVTGFLVDSLDAAVDAIDRIGEIDRAACRAAVSSRFTVDLMADRYLGLYRSILG